MSDPWPASWSTELRLYHMINDHRFINDAKDLMKEHPELDVNWVNLGDINWSPIHNACHRDNDEGLALLLAHPHINVNPKSKEGSTPFMLCCHYRAIKCAKLLIADDRTDLNENNNHYNVPLDAALDTYVSKGLEIFKWWLASGREMKTGTRPTPPVAIESGVEALVKQFKVDMLETRPTLHVEFGWYRIKVAEYFALIVFLCDGLLDLRDHEMTRPEDARFFNIVRRLPMELQMCICHRIVGSMSYNIGNRVCEAAFCKLARELK